MGTGTPRARQKQWAVLHGNMYLWVPVEDNRSKIASDCESAACSTLAGPAVSRVGPNPSAEHCSALPYPDTVLTQCHD